MKHCGTPPIGGFIEMKGEGDPPEDDANAIVTKALDGLRTTIDERFTAIESKTADFDKVTKRLDAIELKVNRPGGGSGGGDETKGDIALERKAIAHFVRTGDNIEFKSMSVGSDPQGGYFVMPAMSAGMTKKLFDSTPMRRISRVETITVGDAWIEPVDKDDVGASWVGEKQSRPATDTPGLAELNVPVHEIYANQPVTQRLLDDTGFNLGAWLEGKVTDRFIRSEGEAFISGTGVSKPRGFLTYPIVSTADATRDWFSLQYVASGSATVIAADAVKAMTWKLRSPYRAGAVFLMNSNTASALDQLKDGQGQYLWRTGMTAGAPSTLVGYPVEIDENMPDIAGGNYPIAFGNFALAYVIVDKVGVRFIRDNVTDKPNVLFYYYKRVGGGLANSEALKLMKIATS